MPAGLARIALDGLREIGVIGAADGLAAGGVGVARRAAVDLEGVVQRLQAVDVVGVETAVGVGIALHAQRIGGDRFGRGPQREVVGAAARTRMGRGEHLDRALAQAPEIGHAVAIGVHAFGAPARDVGIGFFTGAALGVGVVLRGGFGGGLVELPDLGLAAFRCARPQHHDPIVIDAGAATRFVDARRRVVGRHHAGRLAGGGIDGGILLAQTEHHAFAVAQRFARGVVAAGFDDAGVDVVALGGGQRGHFGFGGKPRRAAGCAQAFHAGVDQAGVGVGHRIGAADDILLQPADGVLTARRHHAVERFLDRLRLILALLFQQAHRIGGAVGVEQGHHLVGAGADVEGFGHGGFLSLFDLSCLFDRCRPDGCAAQGADVAGAMKGSGSRSRQLWPLGEKRTSWVQGHSARGTVLRRSKRCPFQTRNPKCAICTSPG